MIRILAALITAVLLSACTSTSTQTAALPSLPTTTAAKSSNLVRPSVRIRPAAGTYTFNGCPVYAAGGKPDPIVNGAVSNLPVDPNSASLLSKHSAAFGAYSDAYLEAVAIANTKSKSDPTPMVTVTYGGGHNPPISPGRYGGGAGQKFPWESNFPIEGSKKQNCSGDCHVEVLDTAACYMYEGTGYSYVNGVLKGYNGLVDNLNVNYSAEGNPWSQNKVDNSQVAGIPIFGFSDFDVDYYTAASGKPINHPLSIIVPEDFTVCSHGTSGCTYSGPKGTNYSPGVGADGKCNGPETGCMLYGDVYRLKPGLCNAITDPPTKGVCNQLATFGGPITATQGTGHEYLSPRMGMNANGTNPWDSDSAFWKWWGSLNLAKEFDIVKRGSIVPK